ncbi:hypothetical protein EMPS_09115 [Entomortierella parvispora]|uniref:Uncharacterized protein n=1 Tax=Entomortierella parvispora TaxID=205924 RepID=A0A9P3HHN0_9FUNG|nr:hypothetical protein EMPS_09115 [Entomortierella parvispora]
MSASYTPLSQRPSNHRARSIDDLESNTSSEDGCSTTYEKPYQMTIPQKQLAGFLAFVWCVCVWIALKVMETSASRNQSPLLASTNALLHTSDLFHDFTVPLLEIVNRTHLTHMRCGTGSLPPHLLYFLANGLTDMKAVQGETAEPSSTDDEYPSDSIDDKESETNGKDDEQNDVVRTGSPGASPRRYLLVLSVQDAELVLPDLLIRIMEVIAILGPENCHLSIVDEGSQDQTGPLLALFGELVEKFNRGALQDALGNGPSQGNQEKLQGMGSRRQGKLVYTLTTVSSRDPSKENPETEIIPIGLEPLLQQKDALAFDRVVLLSPVLTCAEDILEMIYQSHLQDSEITCGMDINEDDGAPNPGKEKGAHFVYDSSATRDLAGQPLFVEDTFPIADQEIYDRFQKRLPFQVESCWSSVVVVKSSSLLKTVPSTTLADEGEEPCSLDRRSMFCQQLWGMSPLPSPFIPGEDLVAPNLPPSETQEDNSNGIAKIIIVPSILFTSTAKNYARLGLFNGWGLWPKTEKRYRDDQENKIQAASRRPLYGYRPSTANYGYIPRDEEAQVDDEHEQISEMDTLLNEINSGSLTESMSALAVAIQEGRLSETIIPLLRERLESINAVFGVQDIQEAMFIKQETERIQQWRPRSVPQPSTCSTDVTSSTQ